MRDRLIRGLEILLALAVIVGLFVVGSRSMDYRRGQEDYSEAEQIAKLPEKEEVTAPSAETVLTRPSSEDPYAAMLKEEIDLGALKEVNPDVMGWIDIPGTELSYPILQGQDNDYYLKHTWKGEANSVGSVFLECKVDPELLDFNTIIYGHRMRDLSMFGSLKYYENISYWEENPSVYVVIEGEAYRYDIYAAYRADPEDIIYRLKLNSRPRKQELIQFGLDNSVIDTGIVPTTYDRILTLSTCTGSGHESRWVVQGVYRVEAASVPEGAGGVFEGTDDAADGEKENAGDALILSEVSGAESRGAGNTLFGVDLQTVLIAGGALAALIVIVLIIRHGGKKRRSGESS